MPCHDIKYRIGARDKEQLHVIWIIRAKRSERLGCVGSSVAIDLETAGDKVSVCRSGEHRHRVAVLSTRHHLIILERGAARGHKEDQIKVKRLASLLCSYQVSVMHRIKRATHDAKAVLVLRIKSKLGKALRGSSGHLTPPYPRHLEQEPRNRRRLHNRRRQGHQHPRSRKHSPRCGLRRQVCSPP